MSTGVLSPPPSMSLAASRPIAPRLKRWTCDEFHELGDTGVFEGQSLILIDGEILEMPAAGAAHDAALTLLDAIIRQIFTAGFVIRCQMSLVLGRTIDPVPDLAVVAGSARSFLQKPTTAALVGEVSDSSLDYDTVDKACLYASAGISDYWVVDLVNRRLIVFRDPQPDATKPFGSTYANIAAYIPGQNVAPLAAASSLVSVADLLP